MAFEELKQDLIDAEADMRSYMENSEEYLRLKIFKILMRYVTSTAQFLLIGSGIIFSFFFFSLGASLAISEALDSYYTGFIIIGAFYTVISMLFYVFRERLHTPILKKFSKYYFE